MKLARSALLAFIALSMLISCQWAENRDLKRAVSPNEVVGIWVITRNGLDGLIDADHQRFTSIQDHMLDIRSDGTCHIKTILNVMLPSKYDDPMYIDCEGRWSLSGSPPQPEITLEPNIECAHHKSVTYYIDEEGGALILWQYTTDPDAWRYIEFEKMKAKIP